MIQLFKQRDFGDKINVTFQYITQNFRSLGLSMLYIVGPVALLAGIASGIMQSNIFDLISSSGNDQDAADPMVPFRALQAIFSPAFGFSALFSLLSILAVSLVTYAHMKVYATKTESAIAPGSAVVDVHVAEVWAEVQPLIGRGIIISILSAIVTFIATFFLVIPGIYVGIVLSLAIAVMSFEDTDFGQTWNRCFVLIRDKWWSTFGLILVMGILSAVVGIIFTLPAAFISFLVASKLLPAMGSFWLLFGNVIATVGGALLRALIYVAIGFQYTNLVERQEGRGLISAIDAIGTSTQARPSDDETF